MDTQHTLRFWLQLSAAHIAPSTGWMLHHAHVSSGTHLTQFLQTAKKRTTDKSISDKEYQKLLHVRNALDTNITEQTLDYALNWRAKEDVHHIVYPSHPHYPNTLMQLPDAPYLLYIKGNISLLSAPQLAIVGTRTPSPTGKEDAYRFASTLATAGITITSGMAYGIDTAAHHGALQTGTSVAVLGTGINQIYPLSNKQLAHSLTEKGALVSELPLGTKPLAYNFPRRNRIISGLSMGVFVIEAGIKSGSLITARLAAEQNKDVFALPGSIHNPMTKGCHHLIKQGAVLVESVADIYEQLNYQQITTAAHETQSTTATHQFNTATTNHSQIP